MSPITCMWLHYQFEVYPSEQQNWLAVPGLYIFSYQQGESQGTPLWHAVYVGQTTSFAGYIPTHHKWTEAAQLGATHVHALVVEEEELRLSLEKQLIQTYQPRLNVQHRYPWERGNS